MALQQNDLQDLKNDPIDPRENSNMNINDVNSDEDIIDLENSKSHILGLFATLEKKEKEKQMLKVENQSLKQELKESQI